MDLFDTTHTALERATQGATLRQATLAENLANANTPLYRRRDVAFGDALHAALAGGKSAIEAVRVAPALDTGAPLRADGSNVDVDREAAELAKAGLEHEALVSVARVRTDILRSAMGVG